MIIYVMIMNQFSVFEQKPHHMQILHIKVYKISTIETLMALFLIHDWMTIVIKCCCSGKSELSWNII